MPSILGNLKMRKIDFPSLHLDYLVVDSQCVIYISPLTLCRLLEVSDFYFMDVE